MKHRVNFAYAIHEQKLFDKYYKMIPKNLVCDWVCYNGQNVVGQLNLESSMKNRKPMIDISYCMTEAFNQTIMYTVEFNKNKFSQSRLSHYRR